MKPRPEEHTLTSQSQGSPPPSAPAPPPSLVPPIPTPQLQSGFLVQLPEKVQPTHGTFQILGGLVSGTRRPEDLGSDCHQFPESFF